MAGEFDLFESAMRGEWDEVVAAYESDTDVRMAKITKSEDTALHIAVSDGQSEVVRKLVESLGENASNILKIKNDKGNTPLHLAAALGHVDICHCIASKDPSLIAERNEESETPLFLAALQGKKEAFLCLNYLSKEKEISCRNRNGDTVLHAAISGEYLSLAFQIIQCRSDLVNSVNENGLTPLHILASKPHAFQSSTRLRPLDRIIYYCMLVDKLKKEKYDHKAYRKHSKSNTDCNYPQNYETCMTFFQLMKHSIQVFIKPQDEANDEENPEQKSSPSEGEAITEPSSSAMKFQVKDQTKELSESKERLNNGKTLSKKEVGDQKIGVDQLYPPNFATFVLFLKLTAKALLIILGVGIWRIHKITEKKERHTWANQIMNELVDRAPLYKYDDNGRNPKNSRTKKDYDFCVLEEPPSTEDDDTHHRANTNTAMQDINGKGRSPNGADLGMQRATEIQTLDTKSAQPSGKKETPLLIAAKMGVAEMVEKILDKFPVAVQDLNSENKNLVLLAIENRQTRIYQLLLNRKLLGEGVFRAVDNKGNSALHLAATFGEYRPWLIPGAALQMQWEIKWYKFVKKSMPPHFFVRYNKAGKTAKEIFTNTHKDLVKEGKEWLTKTSESCSVVAALIATVAYTTSAAIPGGVDQQSGQPILKDAIPFNIFAITSLVALCFSVTALVFFLAILTSRYEEDDFAMALPRKLLLGLTSLFTSIASILISFCSGHFFILTERLRPAVYPIYVVTCLPMTIFALAQLPLYFDLFWAPLPSSQRIPAGSLKEVCYRNINFPYFPKIDHEDPERN